LTQTTSGKREYGEGLEVYYAALMFLVGVCVEEEGRRDPFRGCVRAERGWMELTKAEMRELSARRAVLG